MIVSLFKRCARTQNSVKRRMIKFMTTPEHWGENFDDQPAGEVVSLPPDFIKDRMALSGEIMDYASHARKVTDIVDVKGDIYRTGFVQVEVEPSEEEEGQYEVTLVSRKNKRIVATGGALLFAAGVGVALQYNRSHRKKKIRR